MAERNAELPEDRRMEYRIGVNLGDVVEEGDRIYGDGVNIAARLESLAESGGIFISGFVYHQVKNRLKFEYEYLGEQSVKNIKEPVPLYRVLYFPGAAAHRVIEAKKAAEKETKAPSFSDKPAIAVPPFVNISNDPGQEYFSDGMAEELIAVGFTAGLAFPKSPNRLRREKVREFKNKVAVITGAASGIGRALAERCIQEGMKAVLADIETPALEQTENELGAKSGNLLAVETDVSKESDIKELAKKTVEKFGAVHLLFNNAGVVCVESSMWELTQLDWQWIMGVNLWGVIHGLKVFVPIMLQQDSDGHIVNTASIAGLSTMPDTAYAMTKHGIVGLTEALYLQLRQINAKIGVSVLCPGLIKTRIFESARNRPAELQNESASQTVAPQQEATMESVLKMVETAMSPAQYADMVFKAIKEEKFYVFSEDKYRENVLQRIEIILDEGTPEISKYFP